MKKSVANACAAIAFVTLGAGTALPQETGMAGIHEWMKVGRNTCMLDHFHDGNGTGRTRRDAEQSAIRSWVEFTAWEYGTPWGNFRIAVSKSMNCTGGNQAGWTCHVQARPCRPF